MSKYIHCGKWNKNYKYIVLTTIFAFLTHYIFGFTFNDFMDDIKLFNQTIHKDNKDNITGNCSPNDNDFNKDNNHIIINYIFRYLGLILFSFGLYIYELLNKKKNFKINLEDNISNSSSSSIKLIHNNSEENAKNKIIISPTFILIIMIIMVLQEISEDIFYSSNLRGLNFWMLELPLLSYFNLKYFKFKIFRHHKLVIYLNLIVCSILRIIYLILIMNDNNVNDNDKCKVNFVQDYKKFWGVIPLGIITSLIIMIYRAFALSEIKVLMQYKYISPIKLLIIYGIIGTIITTIIGLISTFIECTAINSSLDMKICNIEKDKTYFFENFKIWAEDINIGQTIFLLIGIIMNCFYRLFYFLIIKNLTAIHILFSNLFSTYFLVIIGSLKMYIYNHSYFQQYKFYVNAFIFLIHIIIFVGLLIYLEMIELDFCNLNYNLRKSIIDRSIQDSSLEIDDEED